MVRKSIRSVLAGAVAVGGFALGALVAPAAAQAGTTTKITFTVKTETGSSVAWLTCGPTGGTHDAAKAACVTLTKVGGNIAAVVAKQGMCTMQYAPVTATASGRWRGKVVRYRKTFGNACQLYLKTDVLFRI